MNTRLQVEHPVTEAVTGRDVVADQLRIAAGVPLREVLAGRTAHGAAAAVEVRLYAEDADDGFLPATGRVLGLSWPAGDGIRVDAGISVGDEIGGRFDPLLAKIIASGATREEAYDRLTAALDDTTVLGVVTNLRFLRWVVRQSVVRDGQVRIDTLARIWPPANWATVTALPDEVAADAARLLTATTHDPWSGGWRVNARPTVRLLAEGVERPVAPSSGAMSVPWALDGDTVHVEWLGRSVAIRLAPPPAVDAARRGAAAGGAGSAEVRSPMPGAVLGLHAAAGASVEAGAPILTLEAMKMEHIVPSPAAGILSELLVATGDQVVKGQVVAIVRADPGSAG
jgi:acetyl-CoA/propionyl-CoA carboxylase biotin carboxyl carrier protein